MRPLPVPHSVVESADETHQMTHQFPGLLRFEEGENGSGKLDSSGLPLSTWRRDAASSQAQWHTGVPLAHLPVGAVTSRGHND